MYALIDANNFFVSCERLFRPDLEGKPVVVLSSNDGCAISRSNEAKALGIKMGEPLFKLKERFQVLEPKSSQRENARHTSNDRQESIVSFSANFELYGDISERISSLVTSITPHIELYSVDESFLDLSALDITNYTEWGRVVRARILHDIGIPVSIGIAPTKTLCKIATDQAKKHPELLGAYHLTPADMPDVLAATPVQDIWGIGRKLAPLLRAEGISTALDVTHMRPKRAQQLMGIHGRQLQAELSGTRCLPLQQQTKPQYMIMRGRQFGADTTDFNAIEAAVTSLASRATAELRREQQLTQHASVTLRTNRTRPNYTKLFAEVHFTSPTADIGTISSQLIQAISRLSTGHQSYHAAEVLLTGLTKISHLQTDVFGEVDLPEHNRDNARMEAFDSIRAKYGSHAIRPAAETLTSSWEPRRNLLSPRHTSDWAELPVARADKMVDIY